jgi:DNA-binding NarL/FixJ family response regulator
MKRSRRRVVADAGQRDPSGGALSVSSVQPPGAQPVSTPFDILIVEDEPVVAADLRDILAGAGYRVVGPVDSGSGAIEAAAASLPQLVLMDIHLRGPFDGVEAARRLWREFMLPCVFVTAVDDEHEVKRAAHPGVIGYLVKPLDPRQLLATISLARAQAVTERDRWREVWRYGTLAEAYARIAGEVDATRRAFERVEGHDHSVAMPDAVSEMSAREREVLQLLLSNHRVAAIATLLFISPHTVRNHLKSIFKKLGVGSQVELIERLRHGGGPRA